MRRAHLWGATMLAAAVGCDPQSSGDVAGDPDTAVTPAIDATRPGNIVATLTEWEIALSQDTVSAGEITVQIMNRGNEYHRFEVEGQGMEWVSDSLSSNAETLARLQLAPGTYVVYCPIEGPRGAHRELGMVDTLVVR